VDWYDFGGAIRVCLHVFQRGNENIAQADNIFMPQMLQELELSVGTFGQDGGAKRLHNLFNCHGLAGKLIFCRAYKAECAHAYRLQIGVPARYLKCSAENLGAHEFSHDGGRENDSYATGAVGDEGDREGVRGGVLALVLLMLTLLARLRSRFAVEAAARQGK